MLAKIAWHWGLMNAMAQKAGVYLGVKLIDGRVTPTEVRHATLTCMQCENVPECQRVLSAGAMAPGEVPDFCLNKELLDRLKDA